MKTLHKQVQQGRRLLLWVIWIGVSIPGILCLITLVAGVSEILSANLGGFTRIWFFIATVLLFFVLLGAIMGRGMLRRKAYARVVWTGLGSLAGVYFTVSGFSMGASDDLGLTLLATGLCTLTVSLLASFHPDIRAYYRTRPGDEMKELLDEIGE